MDLRRDRNRNYRQLSSRTTKVLSTFRPQISMVPVAEGQDRYQVKIYITIQESHRKGQIIIQELDSSRESYSGNGNQRHVEGFWHPQTARHRRRSHT